MPLSPRQSLPSSSYTSTKNDMSSPLTQIHGKRVLVNGKEIALFYYKDEFYAVDEKCPHLGKSQYTSCTCKIYNVVMFVA